MKKLLLVLAFAFLALPLMGQNGAPYWSLQGNNNVSSQAKLGTTNGVHLRVFTNNNERMRVTALGLVSIGSTAPNAKLFVNSPTSVDPLRVLVNNSTKFLVHRNGGVSVGYSQTPPADGLLVNGNVALGTANVSPFYRLQVIGLSEGNGIFSQGSAYAVHAESTIDYGTGVFSTAGKHGTGVHTYAGHTGVSAQADAYGVYALSEFIGVYANAGSSGVVGGSSGGTGVFGSSATGVGVRGRGFEGYGGFFTSDDGLGLYATTTNGPYAAIFEGAIYSSATFQSSDRNLKKNVREVDNALELISRLKPRSYEFRNDGTYRKLSLSPGKHYGLVAQEVEEVLPHLVKESAHHLPQDQNIEAVLLAAGKPGSGQKPSLAPAPKEPQETISLKAVNYTELIPLLIKAVQEQQETIHLLSERITQLEASQGKGASNSPNETPSGIILHQNQPNPFDQATTFRYSLPPGASAQLRVYEASSGKLLKTVPAPAAGTVTLNTPDLSPGTYLCTLVVNGKIAATKTIVLAR
ncbi:tail fiber domain-containing protein [Rufibacter psychrotolerans]|uniref:tail fiber domain-containing protein n=1 Tax=Rufibacter psychrotolerans TaxID=2812556 RepID=UPI0019684C15|nr:tail fiber domain-containing protein [Rufibacter sp. SYSU D00308]